MIVFNDKTYSISRNHPNSDWTNVSRFIIDEGTEDGKILVEKIKIHAPYYDFVLYGEGKLIDITPTEKPPEPPPAPTEVELISNYLLDVDMRLVMIELGL